jgi:hypothetical protein
LARWAFPKTTSNSDARLRNVAHPVVGIRRATSCDVGLKSIADNDRRLIVARKPATRVEYTLFDVVYEDGSRRSNRRVPSDILGGLDGDAPARAVIEEQDRVIAERAGTPPLVVQSIHRSGSKKADETPRSRRSA